MNPKIELNALPDAVIPDGETKVGQDFSIIGIDPNTSKGAQTAITNLPFMVSNAGLTISYITQAQYSALTPDDSTIYVIDDGDRIYFRGREIEQVGEFITLLATGEYVDTGVTIDLTWQAFSFELHFEGFARETTEVIEWAGSPFASTLMARTSTVGAVGVINVNNISSLTLRHGSDTNWLLISLQGTNLLAGLWSFTHPLNENVAFFGPAQNYTQQLIPAGSNFTLPASTAFVDSGINIPNDCVWFWIVLTIGTASGTQVFNMRKASELETLLSLPSVTAGSIPTEANSLPFQSSRHTIESGSRFFRYGRASNGNLMWAVSPASLTGQSYIPIEVTIARTPLPHSPDRLYVRP